MVRNAICSLMVVAASWTMGNSAGAKTLQATSIPTNLVDNKQALLQHVMEEFYGSYNKARSCWISKHGATTFCMKPARLDIVGAGPNKKYYIAIVGPKLNEDGEPEECHACTGALGLVVLAEDGSRLGVVAKNDLFEDLARLEECHMMPFLSANSDLKGRMDG